MTAALDPDAIRSLAPTRTFSLDGKTAVVTGAAGGSDAGSLPASAPPGAAVLVTDLDAEGLDDLADRWRLPGSRRAHSRRSRRRDAPERIVAAAVERFGGLHVLVNNAAVNRRMPILEMDRETWD